MPIQKIENPGEPGAGPEALRQASCWAGCWGAGGCWGGCWPSVQDLEPEATRRLLKSIADTPGAPDVLREMFNAASMTIGRTPTGGTPPGSPPSGTTRGGGG